YYLLIELECDCNGKVGDRSFRCRCPVHGGDGFNCEIRGDGQTLPIYWSCFSQQCHKNPKLKRNLLGLVRGAISGNPDRPASLNEAQKFVVDFLARYQGPSKPSAPRPIRERTPPRQPTLQLTRSQVRGRLRIPSPYFLSRGFSPAILDEFDVGESG